MGQFLSYFNSPLNISDYSSPSYLNTLKLTISLSNKLLFWIISFSNLQGKIYGFLFSHSILHIYLCFSSFCESFFWVCVFCNFRTWVYSIGLAKGALLILVIWCLLHLYSWLFLRCVSWLCCSVHIILMVDCHNDRYLWLCDWP